MIGIFDSGSGGLTVLRAIRERLPSSDVLYFGDIKNAPYGPRSRSELSQLTVTSLRFLAERGATSIVSACNSVSASLAVSLVDALPFSHDSLIEMAGPTVTAFRGSKERIVLFATQATVDSHLYQDGFAMLGTDIAAVAIPDLAGAIESGTSQDAIRSIVAQACSKVSWSEFDVAILACTHYPLVLDVFRECIPAHVEIFDPAEAVAERVEHRFWPREAGDGRTRFVISQDSAPFRSLVGHMFPDALFEIEVLSQRV
jgi:glutamate racemase